MNCKEMIEKIIKEAEELILNTEYEFKISPRQIAKEYEDRYDINYNNLNGGWYMEMDKRRRRDIRYGICDGILKIMTKEEFLIMNRMQNGTFYIFPIVKKK